MALLFDYLSGLHTDPEKNLNQGGSGHKCVKGLLSLPYVKLMNCSNRKLA